MHKSSILRMQWFVENYASKIAKDKITVLDIGSYDVNGSYNHLFDKDKFLYTGMDMVEGPNVDIAIENPYDWSEIETDSYDVVISGQAFEHIEFFWITMTEMARVLKKDGVLCLVVPNQTKEHRHPVDCYRFDSDGMVALARYVGFEALHAHTNCAPSRNDIEWYSIKDTDSMLVAKKPYEGKPEHPDLSVYQCIPPDQELLRGDLIPFNKNDVRLVFMIHWFKFKNRRIRRFKRLMAKFSK